MGNGSRVIEDEALCKINTTVEWSSIDHFNVILSKRVPVSTFSDFSEIRLQNCRTGKLPNQNRVK